MLPLPGGAGLSPVLGNARRLSDFTLPAGTFKRFELEQVVRLLLDVLSGLAALHEVVTDGRAFVHGHVSPQHIYVDEHGTARLVPLLNGVKVEDAGYTAPERLVGGAVDARADVFSVGVMLWEALAGKRLFPRGLSRTNELKAPPIRLSPDARWAQPLCALAERAIALDPSVRFASALELSHALEAAAAQRLSRVDTDAWQEEAPTPVFQPRLHLATLRASTPPPSVITIAPAPAPEAAPAVATAPAATAASVELLDSAVPASRRRGRVAWLGVAVLALGATALGVSKSPRSWQRLAASVPALAAARAPLSVVEVPVPKPAATLASAFTSTLAGQIANARAIAAADAAPPALPATSASAQPAPPLAAAKAARSAALPTLPASPPPPKRKAPSRAHADDYGI
jgi:serine/threonine-protein kinase